MDLGIFDLLGIFFEVLLLDGLCLGEVEAKSFLHGLLALLAIYLLLVNVFFALVFLVGFV